MRIMRGYVCRYNVASPQLKLQATERMSDESCLVTGVDTAADVGLCVRRRKLALPQLKLQH